MLKQNDFCEENIEIILRNIKFYINLLLKEEDAINDFGVRSASLFS